MGTGPGWHIKWRVSSWKGDKKSSGTIGLKAIERYIIQNEIRSRT